MISSRHNETVVSQYDTYCDTLLILHIVVQVIKKKNTKYLC